MTTPREPWRRSVHTDRDKMSLPTGKTCGDCGHFARCKWLIGCNPANEVCDWSPSRFRAAVIKEAAK